MPITIQKIFWQKMDTTGEFHTASKLTVKCSEQNQTVNLINNDNWHNIFWQCLNVMQKLKN